MQIQSGADWLPQGRYQFYRYLDSGAGYDPDSPYATSGGRFDDGVRETIYLASTPEGAVAEYLRRHPELFEMQDALRINVHEVRVRIEERCLDVRSEDKAARAGVDLPRLLSNHPHEHERYAYSRDVAASPGIGIGIAYPSAAHAAPAWCLVLFGQAGAGWVSEGFERVPRPWVDPKDVTTIPA
ncbi:RES family NAD+ phosphorylase [Blastococcus sp. SYSU D00695]